MDNWRKAARSNPNGACVEIGSEWRKASFSQGANNCAEVGAWRKSSLSFSNGNCAEVANWRKSQSSESSNCVEAGAGEQVVGVRDTKQADLGEDRTVLEFSTSAWRRFLDTLR